MYSRYFSLGKQSKLMGKFCILHFCLFVHAHVCIVKLQNVIQGCSFYKKLMKLHIPDWKVVVH